MYVGEKTTLKVKKVKPTKASKKVIWKSSNKKVATISKAGRLKGKKKGSTKITASIGKLKKTMTVKVKG